MESFGDRVKMRINELDTSMAEVSRRMGRGESYARDLVRGKAKQPLGANLQKLASILETSPEWLLTGKAPAEPEPSAEVINIWSRIVDKKDREQWLALGRRFANDKDE